MRRTSLADMQCSIAQSLEIVGEWWTLMIVRSMFGYKGLHRFDEIRDELGIARNVLTSRLEMLLEHEIIEKRQYSEHPPRYEYHLTRKGQELFPVIASLLVWGDKWTTGPEGPPVILRHTGCGHEVVPQLSCNVCHEPLDARNVTGHDAPHIAQRGRKFAS